MTFLTVPEVAIILRIRRARAYELIRRGLLPAVRLGRQIRVSQASLEAFTEWAEPKVLLTQRGPQTPNQPPPPGR